MGSNHVFIDTNVIIDLIADRKPFNRFAIELFKASELGRVKLYTSSHSIATTHYLLKKYIREKELRKILIQLFEYIDVIAVDADTLLKSLRSSHKDLEDAIQMQCAAQNREILCIVTRNIKDFQTCALPVFTPDEYCNRYLSFPR